MKYLYGSTRTTILSIILIASAFMGCMPTTRLVPVWRPWTRSVGDVAKIQPDAYALRIEGEDHTTVADPGLVETRMGTVVEDLLQRRGFTRSDASAPYVVTLKYRAGSQLAMSSTTMMDNRTSASSFWAGMAAANASRSRNTGLGVAIATLVGLAAGGASASSSTVVQSTGAEVRYDYALSLVVTSRDGTPLWQGDAVWASQDLDIIDEIRLPLQLLASELPSSTVAAHVHRVKEDREETFYELYCKDRWFSSPAVPYRIQIKASSFSDPINNGQAYAAYLDLLERAEISVPINFRFGEDDYRDVADPRLWRKVLLGGEYRIGPLNEAAKILIRLETNASGGYNVADARIATDEEYSAYLTRLSGWRAALKEYYDVFD
jgi:hypothetical protein